MEFAVACEKKCNLSSDGVSFNLSTCCCVVQTYWAVNGGSCRSANTGSTLSVHLRLAADT